MNEQSGQSMLGAVDEHELVAQLTRDVLGEAAPEEIEVFESDAHGWLEGSHDAGKAPEDMVGFGVETAVVLLTPYVVAAATAAVRYVAGVLSETADAELRPRISHWVRRLFGHQENADQAAHPPGLPTDVVRRVREVTLSTCLDMGLEESDAALVSDAVAGRLVLPAV